MAIPPRLSEIPARQDIEGALSQLCTNALRTWWILERARILLGLDSVRAYVKGDPPDERDYAVALRKYLETTVKKIESPQYRTILEIVLGLGEERWRSRTWRHETAQTRREEAGRRFRAEETNVTPGTIRQHHEPRAIRQLAELIVADEQAARASTVAQTSDS